MGGVGGGWGVGGALGVVAVIVRQELVLFIMGGVFVVEAVSVIIQLASFQLPPKPLRGGAIDRALIFGYSKKGAMNRAPTITSASTSPIPPAPAAW